MTYNELQQAVQDYLETSGTKFVNNIPLFVRAVENKIYNEVQLPELRRNVTGFTTVGNKYVVVPDNFLSVFSLAVMDAVTGEYNYLLFKDVNFMREVYPNPTTLGMPKYFGLFNATTLIVAPTPDITYSVEMHYFYYPTSIVDAGASWVGDNFPSVMLYGTIAEGYRFQKGEPNQQAIYDAQYQEALGLLRKLGEGKLRADSFNTVTNKLNVTVGE